MVNTSKPVLELKKISKHFTGVAALSGISFNVSPGEVLCLLGDNGAGKSTLIKILSGVHRPTQGEVLVDGNPVKLRSPRESAGPRNCDSTPGHRCYFPHERGAQFLSRP